MAAITQPRAPRRFRERRPPGRCVSAGRVACVALLCGVLLPGATLPDLAVEVDDPQLWAPVLGSVGLEASRGPARFRILVGGSREALQAGFEPTEESVRVASVVDARDPQLAMFWEQPIELPVYKLPAGAKVFVREKRTGAPLLAGVSEPAGGLLWAAIGPGQRGYERFPYLAQALVDLGLVLPFRGARTWAFFDYSYRMRVDVDHMARRWRRAGIAALHVSAWHFHDPEPERATYLQNLIAACDREGVLVYAWLELPHVSEGFWAQHPECREKTAILQDAQLDWRKLINLADPACFERAAAAVKPLLLRFDWDGVNLAELYFESLHGPSNAPRFTPMNDWVREDVRARLGFDPAELFEPSSGSFWNRNQARWRAFADYRAELALRLQRKWLGLIRETLPEADLAVTQIDDRFDDRMREFLGADAAALLPLAAEYDFRLVVEDPATLWHLGPDRYPEIARRYRPLTADPERLAIDINIVERYQQTYPTKRQAGIELFQLLRLAGQSFSRVLLYFEHSISEPDWSLMPFAAAQAQAEPRVLDAAGETTTARELVVRADQPVGVHWTGAAEVDGRLWPASDGHTVWLPAGRHTVRQTAQAPAARLLYLNGNLENARARPDGIDFEYQSASNALALLDRAPTLVELDGVVNETPIVQARNHWTLLLPRGRHRLRVSVDGLLP